MKLTASFPDWLYNDQMNGGNKDDKDDKDTSANTNIVALWLTVIKIILQSVIDEPNLE